MSSSPLFLLAELPAVPTDSSGRYVAAAYMVFLVLMAVYVAIMAQRMRRAERLARELETRVAERDTDDPPPSP